MYNISQLRRAKHNGPGFLLSSELWQYSLHLWYYILFFSSFVISLIFLTVRWYISPLSEPGLLWFEFDDVVLLNLLLALSQISSFLWVFEKVGPSLLYSLLLFSGLLAELFVRFWSHWRNVSLTRSNVNYGRHCIVEHIALIFCRNTTNAGYSSWNFVPLTSIHMSNSVTSPDQNYFWNAGSRTYIDLQDRASGGNYRFSQGTLRPRMVSFSIYLVRWILTPTLACRLRWFSAL